MAVVLGQFVKLLKCVSPPCGRSTKLDCLDSVVSTISRMWLRMASHSKMLEEAGVGLPFS